MKEVYAKGGFIPPSEDEMKIVQKFIDDLRIAEQNGGAVVVPECVKGWKKLDDGTYFIMLGKYPPEIPVLGQ